jgi:hypothetical protein
MWGAGMTMTAAAVFGLIALAIVVLGVLGPLAGSNDDDDMDLREYSDWQRLR